MSGDGPQIALHTRRLQGSLAEIEELVKGHDPDSHVFDEWRSRTRQSLTYLFGEDHDYVSRFRGLRFSEMVMKPFGAPRGPTSRDMAEFRTGLQRAESILGDALEELLVLPAEPSTPSTQEKDRRSSAPHIVVNVHNTLSNINVASFSQIMEAAATLPADQIEAVQQAAEEFRQEAERDQRWPVLAQAVDKLQKLGTEAYKRVAIPLVLEYLKKQAGL